MRTLYILFNPSHIYGLGASPTFVLHIHVRPPAEQFLRQCQVVLLHGQVEGGGGGDPVCIVDVSTRGQEDLCSL